jgi:6-phosphofructokinase 1
VNGSNLHSLLPCAAISGRKIGILAAGGPAPGINAVIGAATIRAQLAGIGVVGIKDGFRHLMTGSTEHVFPLTIENTSRIQFRGGSFLGISRGSPVDNPEAMAKTLEALDALNIGGLITIGGNGTAFVAGKLTEAAKGRLSVVHVPKTIDNDVMLPDGVDSFGYQTARHLGVNLIENLMVDARTTGRWYFVVAQGRQAGHLALGIGKGAGASISLIPEEFAKVRGRTVPLAVVVDTLAGAVLKRLALGRPDGVAVLAEGLVEVIDPNELAAHVDVPRDSRGNLAIAQIPVGDVLRRLVDARLKGLGLSVTLVDKEIGYELRCADPIPYDMEYSRDLGYLAAYALLQGDQSIVATMQAGRFVRMPLSELLGDGEISPVRRVDTESDRYRIAHAYMLRIKRADFENPDQLRAISAAAKLTPEAFVRTFSHVLPYTGD